MQRATTLKLAVAEASLTELADSQHIIIEGLYLRKWSFEVLVVQVYRSTNFIVLNIPKHW